MSQGGSRKTGPTRVRVVVPRGSFAHLLLIWQKIANFVDDLTRNRKAEYGVVPILKSSSSSASSSSKTIFFFWMHLGLNINFLFVASSSYNSIYPQTDKSNELLAGAEGTVSIATTAMKKRRPRKVLDG